MLKRLQEPASRRFSLRRKLTITRDWVLKRTRLSLRSSDGSTSWRKSTTPTQQTQSPLTKRGSKRSLLLTTFSRTRVSSDSTTCAGTVCSQELLPTLLQEETDKIVVLAQPTKALTLTTKLVSQRRTLTTGTKVALVAMLASSLTQTGSALKVLMVLVAPIMDSTARQVPLGNSSIVAMATQLRLTRTKGQV